jgi:hypothetical protein
MTSFRLTLLSVAVELLLPILLPLLSSEGTIIVVRMLTVALRLSPIYYSKILFGTVYRAVIAFAPDLARDHLIHFPQS